MWVIEFIFSDEWIPVSEFYDSRMDAEWALARWRSANDCRKDISFRVMEEDGCDLRVTIPGVKLKIVE